MKAPYFALAAGVLVLAACSGSRSFSKRASKLDQAGMYAEAADMYLQSAVRNARNIDAKVGLKKTGQMVLNDKLGNFFKAFGVGDDKEAAVNAYLAAKDYQDRVQRAGVMLEVPDSYAQDYKQVKGEYLVQLYTQGHDLLDGKDYAAAETVFGKIAKLEPGYKDAGSLQQIAYLEPLYLAGKQALASGQFRLAYGKFDNVVAANAVYKDAAALKQQCVDKGRYAIAVLPFSVPGASPALTAQAATLQAYVISAIVDANDPFIQVVDRDNMQKILDEQKLGMSGVVDESTAVSAGKLLGAKAVVMGNVMAYGEDAGRLRRSTKDGYESYQVKEVDKETNEVTYLTKYRPVKYTELYQENKAKISFSYKLVSLETGQVLLSKVVDQQADDHAWYATYDGNASALLPMQNGTVNTNGSARRELNALLAAPRTVKSTLDLGNQLLRNTSSAMAKTIEQELAAKLP